MLFRSAHANGITESELRRANPGMESPDYVLKKGDKILIPVSQNPQPIEPVVSDDDVRQRSIRMGVMLPLHDNNGDADQREEYLDRLRFPDIFGSPFEERKEQNPKIDARRQHG